MNRYQINNIVKKAILFHKLAQEIVGELPEEDSQIFYRAQPKNRDLFGHTSGLAYEKVPGIFAFEDPSMLFDTYSWIHMKKNLDNYEMITFEGKLIDKPADSEGVVVKPEQIIEKVPLRDFVQRFQA